MSDATKWAGEGVTIRGQIAPEHATPDLVPRYASVPEWVSWFLTFVSSIGGAFLGVALAPSAGTQKVVELAAKSCAAGDVATCKELTVRNDTPTWLLVLGTLLLVLSLVGYIFAHVTATSKRVIPATTTLPPR